MPRPRRHPGALLLLAVVAFAAGLLLLLRAGTGADAGSLSDRYQSHQKAAGALSSKIAAESSKIQGYEGTAANLTVRLHQLESTIAEQERVLGNAKQVIISDRARVAQLKRDYARDQKVLAAQLVQHYESPPPSVVDVIVDSHGFSNLLNGVRNIQKIASQDLAVTQNVAATRDRLTRQANALWKADAAKIRQNAAVVTERNQIAELRLSIVDRELDAKNLRSTDAAHLRSLRATLAAEAHVLEKHAEAAEIAAYKTGGTAPTGCVNTAFIPHGGPYGFFPAAGTDYTVNEEPVLAARLDTLGRALDLHLIGISGYRSPEHSVEVGGFADDPHTKGEASDTPGVEGVPESVLERFCLTRPFPGPREADHIQELGSSIS